MENEALKAAILAKCGELEDSYQKNGPLDSGKYRYTKKEYDTGHGYLIWGCGFELEFDETIDSGDLVWPLAAKVLEIAQPPFPRYDRDFEQSIFDWADKNDDLGWATDGRHTFKSVSNNGLIRGAIYMYDRLKRVFPASIPSKDILWEAFQKGAYWSSFSTPSMSMKEKFEEFLKELSTNPIKSGKELPTDEEIHFVAVDESNADRHQWQHLFQKPAYVDGFNEGAKWAIQNFSGLEVKP